ncbi:hypothetical protein MTR_4g086670 [Medicago truncatula]|uniref:Uncharacterized protein n=1 Tax=Medicago truncatula TaxID=3880 RepID=G7JMG7_MEDTR|nr:hypothetical protein MTR_4g086670 [Medicago truncatula]
MAIMLPGSTFPNFQTMQLVSFHFQLAMVSNSGYITVDQFRIQQQGGAVPLCMYTL